ncbi:hypothetical protein CTP10_R25580 [Cupriavidus sp. P-10]|uniref:hypothetical protein n=1 Tax=unclassified Cupriavidus TaxID=2640874 RepID=UPI000E2F376A|nr:hypothetical protein [Cupriavidus sp. P-10]BDB25183.1 hypothetical protein CTP10_R25580 [Cupriavidus sp. P-10]
MTRVIFLAILFAIGYQAVMLLLGARILRRSWLQSCTLDDNIRILLAPIVGVLAHALITAAALSVDARIVKFVLPAICIFLGLTWRKTQLDLKTAWPSLGLNWAYGLFCFAILVSFEYGAARGENLFWTLYRLTAITPGDSPQALWQAQYLLYGKSLANLQNFSLFDRPFLGGLITLGALTGIGRPPGSEYNLFPAELLYFYIALWTWLNANIALAVTWIGRRFVAHDARVVLYFIVLASPALVFNITGTWPKLFGVYVAVCAAALMLSGRYLVAAVMSGITFLIHGSFLWAHLSLCGVLILYLIFCAPTVPKRLTAAGSVLAIAAAFPGLWFVAERLTGDSSALRLYYLYDVSVSHGFHHGIEEIARNFYRQTTAGNLSSLPFMNLLKALVPYELFIWLGSFSYKHQELTWRSFASALFLTQMNRPLFGFCVTAGIVAIVGMARSLGTNWKLSLAVIAFFLLPLIPGMALYRRDDHFILGIMLFALVPMVLAVGAGLSSMSAKASILLLNLVGFEYWLVYLSRYPSLRYPGEFHEFYVWLVGIALVASVLGVVAMRMRMSAHGSWSTVR